MKEGWGLLVVSLFCSAGLWFLLGAALDGEYFALIGAIVGFMAPSIVYFGNRIE